MSSLTDHLQRWNGVGRPRPDVDPRRSDAIRQAEILLERVKAEPSFVFRVDSELDKHSLYALAEIASSKERNLASRLLANADWAHDEFGELADLRSAVSLMDTFERTFRLQNRDEIIDAISVNERLRAAMSWFEIPIVEKTVEV